MNANIVKLFLLLNFLLTSIPVYLLPTNPFVKPEIIKRLNTCFKNGNMCSEHSECCSKICEPLNLSKKRFCVQSLQHPTTTEKPTILMDGSCRANDVVCVDDDQCCSKKCFPIGFNKYSHCVD